MKDYSIGKIKNSKRGSRRKKKDRPNYSKLLLKFLKGSIIMLSICSTGALAYISLDYLYESPYFQVQQVIVNGEKRLTEVEVLNLARIDIGGNILDIGLKDVSDRIEQHPWVEKVLVKRRLPLTIIINITEKTPVAIINLDRLYLVDKNGVIFKEVGPEDLFDIPVLTGLESADLATNESVSVKLIKKALHTLDEINKRKILGADEISEINMDPYTGLTIVTLNDATQIKLGSGDLEKKLGHLKKVMADLQKKHKKVEYINLTYGERVYVKLEKDNPKQTLLALRKRPGR